MLEHFAQSECQDRLNKSIKVRIGCDTRKTRRHVIFIFENHIRILMWKQHNLIYFKVIITYKRNNESSPKVFLYLLPGVCGWDFADRTKLKGLKMGGLCRWVQQNQSFLRGHCKSKWKKLWQTPPVQPQSMSTILHLCLTEP